jgi:hypothetical protein
MHGHNAELDSFALDPERRLEQLTARLGTGRPLDIGRIRRKRDRSEDSDQQRRDQDLEQRESLQEARFGLHRSGRQERKGNKPEQAVGIRTTEPSIRSPTCAQVEVAPCGTALPSTSLYFGLNSIDLTCAADMLSMRVPASHRGFE